MPEDIGQDFPTICRFLALQKIIVLFNVVIYSLPITSHLIKKLFICFTSKNNYRSNFSGLPDTTAEH